MHLSTHNWMRAEPLAVTLKRIKKYGYESIEISGEPTQYPVKETRALLKEHGIRCWGAVTLTLGVGLGVVLGHQMNAPQASHAARTFCTASGLLSGSGVSTTLRPK